MSVPRRPDEIALWNALLAGTQPRYAAQDLGIRRGRVEYLCHKWASKHIYGYGVVHDLGWIEKWVQATAVESVEDWNQRPSAVQAEIVAGIVRNAEHMAREAIRDVAPDPAVTVRQESMAFDYDDPATGQTIHVPALVVVRVEFTPTLDSRIPSHYEQVEAAEKAKREAPPWLTTLAHP